MKPSSTSSSAASSSAGRVGQQRALVADHLELDPVGLERLARELGGEDGVARREAAGRVGQQAHAGVVEHVDDRAARAGVDAPQRDGHELGARGLDRGRQRLERAEAAGAEQQPRAQLGAGDGRAGRRNVGRRHCSLPGSRAGPRPARPLSARACPTACAARPRRRRPRRRRGLPPAGRAPRQPPAPSRPSASSAVARRSAGPSCRHLPRTGAGRPGAPSRAAARRSAAATSSAVTDASRMPLRKWPVAHSSPSIAPGPMAGRLSGVAGRRPARNSSIVELEHAGDELAHVAQQLVDAAGGRRGVVAALLHRGAEHVAAVGAGDEVGVEAADVRSTRPAPRGSRRRSDLALDGADGHAELGQPRPRRRRWRAGPGRRGRSRRRRAGGPRSSSGSDAGAADRPAGALERGASAATRRRGSTEWSPGTSSASRTVGARAGSARRAWLGRSRSTSSPSSRRKASAARAPRRRRGRARPAACRSREAGSCRRLAQLGAEVAEAARAAQVSSTAARSPNCASVTGASMPAATCQAPGSPASSTIVLRPRPAARQAHARPIAPPPATATSNELEVTAGHSLPTPALPGSGSTVGGPLPPSQPGSRGLP